MIVRILYLLIKKVSKDSYLRYGKKRWKDLNKEKSSILQNVLTNLSSDQSFVTVTI